MAIIDKARSFYRQVTDRLCPNRVVFHHVPKCGGTSLGRALRRAYILSQGTVTPEESFRAFELFTGRCDRERMLIDVLDLREQMFLYMLFHDVRCVSAHVRFSNAAHACFGDRYSFVTLLRDPVDRFVSHYLWSNSRPGAHAHIAESFEEFLETDQALRLGATFVEYFSGLPSGADVTSREAIDAAVANLRRLDAVGFLDNLSEFEKQLCAISGKKLSIGHENKGTRRSKHREILEGPLADRIQAICAPDLAVWSALGDLRQANAQPARSAA